jgi:hypothetical protein
LILTLAGKGFPCFGWFFELKSLDKCYKEMLDIIYLIAMACHFQKKKNILDKGKVEISTL